MTNRRFYKIIDTAGIILLIVALALLTYSHLSSRSKEKNSVYHLATGIISSDKALILRKGKFKGNDIDFFEVKTSLGKIDGYIFSSEYFASDIIGYNNKILLLIYITPDGIHQDFRILEHHETSEYFAKVIKSRDIFLGQNIFKLTPDEKLEMVTGATISSNAISKSLRKSGNLFSEHILQNRVINTGSASFTKRSQATAVPVIIFSVMLLFAIIVRYRITATIRYIFLTSTVIILGFIYNIQFSSDQIISLISLQVPAPLTTAFSLAVIMPIMVLIFGNFYCGYLCPVGALQELISLIRPKKLIPIESSQMTIKILSTFKYLTLFALIIGVTFFHHIELLNTDIIRSTFAGAWSSYLYFVVLPAVVFSIFFKRFWCRVFCPTGAFLSILNYAKFARKVLPFIKPGKCDIGVSGHNELDCINCDYCRFERTPFRKPLAKSEKRKLTAGDFLMILATCYLIVVLVIFTI